MNEPRMSMGLAIAQLESQRYGPLYVACTSNALGSTQRVFLLDPGQELTHDFGNLPGMPHPDLRADQEVFGWVRTPQQWSPHAFDWKTEHPCVKNGLALQLVEQLLEANATAIALGMTDYWTRQLWLRQWAQSNLGRTSADIAMPPLD